MARKRKHRVTKGGLELTPEVVEELADEGAAGYDLTKGEWIRVGRPSLGGGGGVSPRANVRFPPDVYEAARLRAAENGESLSELIREAVRQYVGASA